MKPFIKNFILSLLVYLATIFLTYLLVTIMWRADVPFRGVSYLPIWAEIVFWLHSIIVVALLFLFGTKLNLLNNHWLNFLSVCGILTLGLFLTFFGGYSGIFVSFAFFRLGAFVLIIVRNPYISLSIMSLLPSLIIWLGMLYKSSKLKKKQGEMTD